MQRFGERYYSNTNEIFISLNYQTCATTNACIEPTSKPHHHQLVLMAQGLDCSILAQGSYIPYIALIVMRMPEDGLLNIKSGLKAWERV